VWSRGRNLSPHLVWVRSFDFKETHIWAPSSWTERMLKRGQFGTSVKEQGFCDLASDCGAHRLRLKALVHRDRKASTQIIICVYITLSIAVSATAFVFIKVKVASPTGSMVVSCGCCLLSNRGVCDRLITRPEESYLAWCVWVWPRKLRNEAA
jgi:hypothetical protein